MDVSDARARLAFLRTGLKPADLKHPTLEEMQLEYPPEVAKAYFEGRKQLAEENRQIFNESLQSISEGITYSEFALLGEPDCLLSLVKDREEFANKFAQSPQKNEISPVENRMQLAIELSKEEIMRKSQEFSSKQNQFASIEKELEESIKSERKQKSNALNEKISNICERAKEIEKEMAYDGKRTFEMLRLAEAKKEEQERIFIEKKRKEVQEIQAKTDAMRHTTERLNAETIRSATELKIAVDEKAHHCLEHKEEIASKVIERQKQRDEFREQVVENSRKVQEDIRLEKIADAEQIRLRHEEQVEQIAEQRLVRTNELACRTMQMLQQKERARSEMRDHQDREANEKLQSNLARALDAAKEREELESNARDELVAKALQKEQIRNRILMQRRQEDFQSELQGISLIEDPTKFAKLGI